MKGVEKKGNKLHVDAMLHIDPMIRVVADAARLSHIVYKNKNYHDSYDKCKNGFDNGCNEYTKCPNVIPSIIPNDPDDITYVFDWDLDDIREDEDDIDPKLTELVQNSSHERIIIDGFDTLILRNISGYNVDHRGSDHCPVALPFYTTLVIKGPLTLEELATAFSKLKSHKWDYNYEMYCDCEVKTCGPGKNLDIALTFDHGS